MQWYTKIFSLLFPKLIWNIPNSNNEIFLTFDDGPHPEITPWVLDVLKQYDAKATFFCIGDNVKKYPTVYQQIIRDGHSVGNHTMNHINGWKTSAQEYLKNTESAAKNISSTLFRPPYGRITSKESLVIRKKGFDIVMWSFLTRDYNKNIQTRTIIKKAQQQLRSGDIVVFHDSKKAENQLKVLLPAICQICKAKQFKFKSILVN